jgi:hypothetical protein
MNQYVIIESDWYNALYKNGQLSQQGKPEYLDSETMLRLLTPDNHVDYYVMSDEVYNDLLNGAGYPQDLDELPLDRMTKVMN